MTSQTYELQFLNTLTYVIFFSKRAITQWHCITSWQISKFGWIQ